MHEQVLYEDSDAEAQADVQACGKQIMEDTWWGELAEEVGLTPEVLLDKVEKHR